MSKSKVCSTGSRLLFRLQKHTTFTFKKFLYAIEKPSGSKSNIKIVHSVRVCSVKAQLNYELQRHVPDGLNQLLFYLP